MSPHPRRSICIITPGYLSSTPRVVKEADALDQAGFEVRVAFTQGNLEAIRQHDEVLLKEKPWRWAAVGWSPFRATERRLYRMSWLRHHLVRQLHPRWTSPLLAAMGEGRVYPELARLAAQYPAALYIGHYPAGLAAAAHAASRRRAKLGYDIEDLHTAEQPPTREGWRQSQRIEILERRYLPSCCHVTAASDLVAGEIARHYQCARPMAIYNTFPWSDRERLDGQVRDRQGSSLSLYWFSQVIGEGRGIEDAIQAMGLLKRRAQLHLRGSISSEARQQFMALAQSVGAADAVHFHPPVPPTELLSRAVEHDVGLALEPPGSLNHQLTVSNKLFLYLMAGLAVVATDLPGQRSVLSTCPEAGLLYPPGDHRSLADHLNAWLADPGRLQRCKQAALRAAQERWNWEMESAKLVNAARNILG